MRYLLSYLCSIIISLYCMAGYANANNIDIIDRVATSEKIVALTIEGVERKEDIKQLKVLLRKYDFHATFFISASVISSEAPLIKTLLNDGHEFGNCGVKIQHWEGLRTEDISKEYAAAAQLFKIVGFTQPKIFRPAYEQFNDNVIQGIKNFLPEGVIVRGINVEDDDLEAVIDKVKNGDILDININSKTSIITAGKLVRTLQTREYKVYTVSELLNKGARLSICDGLQKSEWNERYLK